MSNDEFKKSFNIKLHRLKTSLQLRTIKLSEANKLRLAFNNIQYKVRIERYIDQLTYLLNNPHFYKPVDCDIEVYFEQVDNYLLMVGEVISGLYDIGFLCEKGSE
ncbi:MAG: hypothetical protein OQK98_09310 [Gammaproteobacteria bacterium]|nr:hypothetical protein [Gammaproteobacteria bacterium]